MDIRKDIKDRVTKRLTEIHRWDSNSTPNIYELNNFLNKAGYVLDNILVEKDKLRIVLSTKKNTYLTPSIIYSTEDNDFTIATKEYGYVVSSDIEEIIKGYENALGVVKHLNSLNLSIIRSELSEED